MRPLPQELHPAGLISPDLRVADPLLSHWLGQASLRLRREICWQWYQRTGTPEGETGTLPPLADAAGEGLDLVRYDAQRKAFFASDPTAAYLSDAIQLPPPDDAVGDRGGFGWLADRLDLAPADRFALAFALLGRLDAALGPVISACTNDQSRPWPTLALVQRLWDEPMAVAGLADPLHPLRRCGVLSLPGDDAGEWQRPLRVHAAVAGVVAGETAGLPSALTLLPVPEEGASNGTAALLADRLLAHPPTGLQLIPLLGRRDNDFEAVAAGLSAALDSKVGVFTEAIVPDKEAVAAAATVCWLRGYDLLLPEGWSRRIGIEGLDGILGLPLRCYLPLETRAMLADMPASHVLPALEVPDMDFRGRRNLLLKTLGGRGAALGEGLDECARRFRLPPRALRRVARGLALRSSLDADTLAGACRQEAVLPLDKLAQAVNPRFDKEDLVLPPEQMRRYEEIIDAMGSLTAVHYGWGTAKAWNDAGLAVMFAGPPGTGKTMAAEALALALDLPMYRVDLSQVVSKYIGETEKNLKNLFDAAETSDCLMFFDEADALFGKRTEVRDSHDRFANIEISYLLERMERFKGLAVLATNRRRDLDDAFLRRLRYIVEFPLPGQEERERIWRQGFPQGIDVSSLDFAYLARQFQLSGGHIRSITLNACLRSAARHGAHRLRAEMPEVLMAVKRELEKANRAADSEQFGRYRETLEKELA